MVTADLHIHTTHSDGAMSFEDVAPAARRAGVEVVCITDHDRLQPHLDAPVQAVDGVEMIHGIELRVDTGAFRVDLLGYGVAPTDRLIEECERLQADRIRRARAITDQVENRLDIEIDVTFENGVGRPHIAHAIADVAPEWSFPEPFDGLIGEGDPCYVARNVPSFERGVDILTEACDIVGLAHPFRYRETTAALELCEHLDAVEEHYPYGHEIDEAALETAIEQYDLLGMGGSDAHNDVLGRAGLDEQQFEPVRNVLTGAS